MTTHFGQQILSQGNSRELFIPYFIYQRCLACIATAHEIGIGPSSARHAPVCPSFSLGHRISLNLQVALVVGCPSQYIPGLFVV